MTVALSALVVLVTWWASTGAVLRVVRLSRESYPASAAVFGVLAGAGFVGLIITRDQATVQGAYLAFASAIAVWAFHELTFLQGIVTGPRRTPCPEDARGLRRFALATATVIHHELALAATLAVVALLTLGESNEVGLYTFGVLWVMRLSSKLNLFLGVRNFTEEFVPEHLRYLISYYRRAKLNPLMPLSLLAGGAGVFVLVRQALLQVSEPFTVVGRVVVATLLALAVLEHVFLALPLRDALLWRWLLPSQEGAPSQADAACTNRPSSPVVSPSTM